MTSREREPLRRRMGRHSPFRPAARFSPRARRAFPMPSLSIRPPPARVSMTAFPAPGAPHTLSAAPLHLPFLLQAPRGTAGLRPKEAGTHRTGSPLRSHHHRTLQPQLHALANLFRLPGSSLVVLPHPLISRPPPRAHCSAPPGTPAESLSPPPGPARTYRAAAPAPLRSPAPPPRSSPCVAANGSAA